MKNFIKKTFLCVLLFSACYGLFHYHPNSAATWYTFIGIILLFILFDRLEKFNLFGVLSGTVRKAKKELNNESDKIKVHLLVSSVISDSPGNEREVIRDFFSNGQIGSTKEITQFSDYSLSKLSSYGFVAYVKQTASTMNGIGEHRGKYVVTLKKQIPL